MNKLDIPFFGLAVIFLAYVVWANGYLGELEDKQAQYEQTIVSQQVTIVDLNGLRTELGINYSGE